MMTPQTARQRLDVWRALPTETEWLDFKEARQNFDTDELGRYLCALANEANLCGQERGWLVLGVKDARDSATGLRPIVGCAWRCGMPALDQLKLQIAQGSAPAMASLEMFELNDPACSPGSRVLMIGVPPAPRGMPVAWKGHYYGRAGSSLSALGARYETIRMQSAALDWSACAASADFSLLCPEALLRARQLYCAKHPRRAHDAALWTDERFLDELRLLRGTQLTRAALLLLGRAQAVDVLAGAAPRLTWRLMDDAGKPLDHAHFHLPLLTALDALVSKIRIYLVRILPPGQLAPLELPNYDEWVIREALLNCVAHQDYSLGGRTVVTETPGWLEFSNAGAFIPGSVEQVLQLSSAIHRYRNPCLADAMVELGLIDTIGSGIQRMYQTQRQRHFPLPDIELAAQPPAVAVRIHGRELDPAFTRMLLLATHLSLADVVALDHVQKKRPLAPAVLADLRRRKLVEGRLPAVYIAASVADATNQRGQYTRNLGLQKPALKQLVLSLIDKFGKASREEIDQALLSAMPAGLSALQKANRIKNLLSEMSTKDGSIVASRRGVGAHWLRADPLAKPVEMPKI